MYLPCVINENELIYEHFNCSHFVAIVVKFYPIFNNINATNSLYFNEVHNTNSSRYFYFLSGKSNHQNIMSSTTPFGIYARIGPEAFHMLQAPELLRALKKWVRGFWDSS